MSDQKISQGVGARIFRRTVGLFPTGVTVVATESRGQIHAMTVSAFTSLSLDPLLVLVCLGKQTRMAELLDQEKNFSINILREDQRALSTYFARGWKEAKAPPFRFVPWEGRPRLEGCLAALGCVCSQKIEGGDHWIVIGEVTSMQVGLEPHHPLVFFTSRYTRLSRADDGLAPDLGWVETPVHVYYDPWKEE